MNNPKLKATFPKDEFIFLGITVAMFAALVGLYDFMFGLAFPNITLNISPNEKVTIEELIKSHRFSLFAVVGLLLSTAFVSSLFVVIFRWRNALKFQDFADAQIAIANDSLTKFQTIENATKTLLHQAKSHTDLLGGMIHPFLITWDKSKLYEDCAEQVFCFTPDLVWAYKHRKDIVEAIKKSPKKKYLYIVADKRTKAITQNEANLRKELERDNILDSVQIKYLEDHPASGEAFMRLPIWVDVVLYVNICVKDGNNVIEKRDRIGVMSTSPIKNLESVEYDKKFDILLTDEVCDLIEADFKYLWNEIATTNKTMMGKNQLQEHNKAN